jgi:hypothetical protein
MAALPETVELDLAVHGAVLALTGETARGGRCWNRKSPVGPRTRLPWSFRFWCWFCVRTAGARCFPVRATGAGPSVHRSSSRRTRYGRSDLVDGIRRVTESCRNRDVRSFPDTAAVPAVRRRTRVPVGATATPRSAEVLCGGTAGPRRLRPRVVTASGRMTAVRRTCPGVACSVLCSFGGRDRTRGESPACGYEPIAFRVKLITQSQACLLVGSYAQTRIRDVGRQRCPDAVTSAESR